MHPSPPPHPLVHYVPRPHAWAPTEEPLTDRLTRTDLRLALAFLAFGTVAVFVRQMPFLAQVVLGAPLFEEMFKLGLALLPCAALGIRTLAVRLPLGLASGGAFGVLEHFLSYPEEVTAVFYGRIAFHALATGLSVLVLHGLSTGPRRLVVACTLPATFIHAGNNTAAVNLALLSLAAGFDPDGTIGLQVAAVFLVALGVAFVTWPLWADGYRALLERHVLPRLGPPGAAAGPMQPSSASRN